MKIAPRGNHQIKKRGTVKKETRQEKGKLDFSRREFIKATAITVGAASALSVYRLAPAQATEKSRGLVLSIAGYRFDRTKALIDEHVKIEGYDIQFKESGIGDINTNVFSGPQSLDVTEIGLHPFMLAYANDGFRDYSLLPIHRAITQTKLLPAISN